MYVEEILADKTFKLAFNLSDAFIFDDDKDTGYFRYNNNHDYIKWDYVKYLFSQKKLAKKYPEYKDDYTYEYGFCYFIGKHVIICNKKSCNGGDYTSRSTYVNKLIWLRLLDFCKILKKQLPMYDWKPLRLNSKCIEK